MFVLSRVLLSQTSFISNFENVRNYLIHESEKYLQKKRCFMIWFYLVLECYCYWANMKLKRMRRRLLITLHFASTLRCESKQINLNNNWIIRWYKLIIYCEFCSSLLNKRIMYWTSSGFQEIYKICTTHRGFFFVLLNPVKNQWIKLS